ncbi:thioesterase [Micromonospora echinospora]|uniref:Surfactin synthase thioesterase subunit n=1 Tax=Micromonospora echinospora TaxID=1877 RepID=A0A1C4YS24_MICEC|nr:thioesterase domain-containing protein [Micromonospora echinospora]OZV77361.1 thioesterase [Micromonospora echinospora]SCF23466.1 Surfactin synthase thioesterase subunit [Micromonospora echinospora]
MRPAANPVWLQRSPSPAAAGRVFCIPQAGCGTNVFENWPREQDSIEFLPVELPGRLTRFKDRMPATFQGLAADMVAGLEPYLDVPVAFFGHCWSAIAAFEVAVHLERRGLPPTRLFVSSELPPQLGPAGRMLDMDEPELTVELEATIRDLGREPHPELVALYVRVLRDDIGLRRRYVASAPLRHCPITAIGWTDDTEYRPEQLAGWADSGKTTFVVFPGRHNRFVDAPAELLDAICAGFPSR